MEFGADECVLTGPRADAMFGVGIFGTAYVNGKRVPKPRPLLLRRKHRVLG